MTKTIPFFLVLKVLHVIVYLVAVSFILILCIWFLREYSKAVNNKQMLAATKVMFRWAVAPIVVPLIGMPLLIGYAYYIEPDWIEVKTIEIKDTLFDERMENLKILQISDLHIEEIGKREKKLVKLVNKQKPDIILMNGDYVNSSTGWDYFYSVITQLKAKIGIYAILGNTDYYFAREQEIVNRLEQHGIKVLLHDSIQVLLGDHSRLWIVGLSDKYGLLAQYEKSEYIDQAFKQVEIEEPKILLVHDPHHGLLEHLKQYRPQLVLAGDTHGGQIGIKFIRELFPLADRGEYMAGMFHVNDYPMYVNRGIGMKHVYVRFLARPEITVVKLENKGK